jgi:hypothetical protein
MAAFFPTDVDLEWEFVEGGKLRAVVVVEFANPVHLVGKPSWHLLDQTGAAHLCTSASPHVSTMANWASLVRGHFFTLESPGPFTLIIPVNDPAVKDAGGNFVGSGSYPVADRS